MGSRDRSGGGREAGRGGGGMSVVRSITTPGDRATSRAPGLGIGRRVMLYGLLIIGKGVVRLNCSGSETDPGSRGELVYSPSPKSSSNSSQTPSPSSSIPLKPG